MERVPTFDEIRDESAGLEEARRRTQRLFEELGPAAEQHAARREAARREAGARRGGGPTGTALAGRLTSDGLRRLKTHIYLESRMAEGDDLDHYLLVFAAGELVEDQLRGLLDPAARGCADSLLRAVSKDEELLAILTSWSRRDTPVTLGVLQILLVSLRRACAPQSGAAWDVLSGRFVPAYLQTLATRGPERCVDRLRRLRNDAAHGRRALSDRDYRVAARLSVGVDSFAAWDAGGPRPAPPAPEEAVLHHHLANLR